MTKKVYIIERIWTASLENDVDRALGYRQEGFVEDEETAKRICEAAGMTRQKCWAMFGKSMPELRYHMVSSYAAEPSESK